MEETANLSLPYILPSQAQKHVTHNEALRILDALVQLSVASRTATTPPGEPSEGGRYIVAADAEGEWDTSVACYVDDAWMKLDPRIGWRAWIEDEETLCVFDGAAWQAIESGGPTGAEAEFEAIGVLTAPDAGSRLSVKSDAVLFSHDDQTPGTGNVRLTLNKAAAGDDAALVLEDDFSTRALIGLLGDDDLTVKVSSDGAVFREALTVDASDGRVSVNEPFFAHSLFNLKGKALTGDSDGWFCFTVTNTNADNTNKGGAVLTGAPYANANSPFMAFGPWASSSAHTCYYGGGAWGVPDATEHQFYAGTYQPTVNNSATVALRITAVDVRANRNTVPEANNTYSLGTSALKWSVVYANTGTINTSDSRLKAVDGPVPLGLDFVKDLEPVAYRWKIGGHEVVTEWRDDPMGKPGVGKCAVDVPAPRPGTRTHYGLVAQQVKSQLERHGVGDFAGWTLADAADPESEQGLRYDQFIPILVRAVQELANQVEALREAG
ncbi:MAG: DUF2793 domain-containing protein [Rhizobiaceae bacterium]